MCAVLAGTKFSIYIMVLYICITIDNSLIIHIRQGRDCRARIWNTTNYLSLHINMYVSLFLCVYVCLNKLFKINENLFVIHKRNFYELLNIA